MGHIAHLRKLFKSINTYDYIITLIKTRRKKNYQLYENSMVLHLKKLKSPSPNDALCEDWLKLAQWFWRRGFLNFVNGFSRLNYLPLEKDRAHHLNKLKSPSSKDAFCQVWLKLTQWLWRRRFFKFVILCLLFRNYLPFKKGSALHLTKLESPSPKEFGCNWLSGSCEDDFF